MYDLGSRSQAAVGFSAALIIIADLPENETVLPEIEILSYELDINYTRVSDPHFFFCGSGSGQKSSCGSGSGSGSGSWGYPGEGAGGKGFFHVSDDS